MADNNIDGYCQDCDMSNEPDTIYPDGNDIIVEFTCNTCGKTFKSKYEYTGTENNGKVVW